MTANRVTNRFNWPTQLFVNCATAIMIATTTLFYRTKRNPICFVRNALAGVLCVMSADVPTASRLYVAIAERGCVRIVGMEMIYAGVMVIVRVAVPMSIAVPMDGRAVNVTSGFVLGAAGATTRARNAGQERNQMRTSNLFPDPLLQCLFLMFFGSFF